MVPEHYQPKTITSSVLFNLVLCLAGQISRLHLILKPFMLRRIKKDVENELTEKVEILLYCPLTIRQKLLYNGLKKKIRIEELLQNLGVSSRATTSSANSNNGESNITSSLMNLFMHLRKVRRLYWASQTKSQKQCGTAH